LISMMVMARNCNELLNASSTLITGTYTVYPQQNKDLPSEIFCAVRGKQAVSLQSQYSVLLSPVVFDWQVYLSLSPDLAAAGITDEYGAEFHWLVYGLKEGRRGNISFSVKEYLKFNPDLQSIAGNSYVLITQYVNSGVIEGRRSSLFFDPRFYAKNNPDVKAEGGDYGLYLKHFILHGIAEGRAGAADFTAADLLKQYPSLKDLMVHLYQ
jgi:hypothetical protein